MKHNLVRIAITLTLLTIGSIQTSAQKATPEDAIRRADQQWMVTFATKDVANSVAFCADDSSVLPANMPIATGKEAIGKLFASFFALTDFKLSWHPTRAKVARSGELGYTSGTYQMTFKDPSGKQVSDTGKYVTIWHKQSSGSWKVSLDTFNSDLPAAP